jgi:hypothetical protein
MAMYDGNITPVERVGGPRTSVLSGVEIVLWVERDQVMGWSVEE